MAGETDTKIIKINYSYPQFAGETWDQGGEVQGCEASRDKIL